MRKRFLAIATLVGIMGAVLFGGCASNGLKTYKSEQSEKLQCYADRRGQENFDKENWDTICEMLASGKKEISRAKNKSAVVSIVSQTKLTIDGVAPKEWDSTIDGVYYITDESWEVYVRMVAEQVGADDDWVTDVLNGGDGGEWRNDIFQKKYYHYAILNNKITAPGSRDFVYQISREGNDYRGDNVQGNITFWFDAGDLCFRKGKETLRFYKDDSYRLIETTSTLTALKNIQIGSGGEGLDFVHFEWSYDYGYGTHGVGVDVKRANEEAYQTVKIEQVWMNQFVIQLDKSKFANGDNWVRLYSIGGPRIRNDKTIEMLENSECTLFCVTVKGDKVKVREV